MGNSPKFQQQEKKCVKFGTSTYWALIFLLWTFFEISSVTWQRLCVTSLHTHVINEYILVNEPLCLRLVSDTSHPATCPLTHRQWGGRLELNCGVKTPNLWPCPTCASSDSLAGWNWPFGPFGVRLFPGQREGGTHAPAWSGLLASAPFFPAEPDTRTHWPDSLCLASRAKVGPLTAFGSPRVLGGAPERPATLVGSAHLAVLSLSGGTESNITKRVPASQRRCFCMNEKVISGRMEDFPVFDFSLICFVQSLFTSRCGNQDIPYSWPL